MIVDIHLLTFWSTYHEYESTIPCYHATYNNVNYAIFILLFLAVIIGNIMLVKLLNILLTVLYLSKEQ